MKNHTNHDKKLSRVLLALQSLCSDEDASDTLPSPELWPKTRHIADYCGIDIYASRRYLMQLVKNHQAYVSSSAINNSLRWYIVK
ncbi:FaeA/PapI family transcriptional regulator [Serratia aquatilis]|uniref:FaeA/PapI family transcriptional regulator n=1 Tax=Serratia aquatilis TaxID=1737515 RepID=A0ABV6ED39_9GAMM